ncbi:hypothetical protein NKH77_00650 [Streptomyces sp. M19]
MAARGDGEEWRPAAPLLVCVDDGGGAAPTRLSWTTEDGRQSSVGFSPDTRSCYGHRGTSDGDVVELRGERDDRREREAGGDAARGYAFDTEVEEGGARRPAGPLRLWIDDGGEAPVRWVSWADQSGNSRSVALRSASPSGRADVSDLVGTVWASAEFPEAGEVARNLVDASTRKWFAPHPRASLEFRLAEPVAVGRYVLTSANDAPDRDPAAWTLRGSADGSVWRTLDTRSGQSFAERHESRTYRIAEPVPYDHYRLDITGNNGSPHLQLAAVRFLADGGGGFVGHHQRAGHAPSPTGAYASRGSQRTPPSGIDGRDRARTRSGGSRSAEWEGWQAGGPWLPLGGRLSMQSLTSPSGRFTALHSVYEPALSVRDNATREHVWISDSPRSNQVCLGPDGDLVAWDHRGNQMWSTGTAWLGVRRLEMRDSGELALTGADGAVVWSSGIPQVPAAPEAGPRTVARGSTMRRGESLDGQSLTSDDGSTVVFHDGRVLRIILEDGPPTGTGSTTSRTPWCSTRTGSCACGPWTAPWWSRSPGRAPNSSSYAAPRSSATTRGTSCGRPPDARRGWPRYGNRRCRRAAPWPPGSAPWSARAAATPSRWCGTAPEGGAPAHRPQPGGAGAGHLAAAPAAPRRRPPGRGNVVAALAVGPDVLVVSDHSDLPVAALAPATSVAALHQPFGGRSSAARSASTRAASS